MVRKNRIEYYGAIYYIIQKGNNRESIFKKETNKVYLLEVLSEAKEIFDFKIFAYVVMDNYYHFLIQTLNIPISKIMHRINTRYAIYYNYNKNRIGCVFDSRYKSKLIQDEKYLLKLIKHIHNNPVYSNICKSMDEYKWSSDMFYRVNMENMVDIDGLLNMISFDRIKAIEIYINLMEENMIDNSLKGVFKDEKRTKKVNFKKLDNILKKVCPEMEEFEFIKRGSRKRYLTEYKIQYIKLSRKEGYTYKEIGENINVTASSVRNIINS